MSPKVFISYSWSSQNHQMLVKNWADQLIADGIEVILDIYDLKEGHDKFSFMEKMVTDSNVKHVLIICDKSYSEKADSRKSGVGTESQIISREVYETIDQSKFIPIVSELNQNGEPYLPTYLKSRIWIDFSSLEAVNTHWEQLIRAIYEKPLYQKPKLGAPPVYITNDIPIPSNNIQVKFNTLNQAITQGKTGINQYRKAFLDECLTYYEELRTRERSAISSSGWIREDVKRIKVIRNYIIDWILLESVQTTSDEFTEKIIEFLESVREIKDLPEKLVERNDAWHETCSFFLYETFLYIVSALIKNLAVDVLHEILTTHYLVPLNQRNSGQPFDTFDSFYFDSNSLQKTLSLESQPLYSPVAELIKQNADREDLPFKSIWEADLLLLLMSLISTDLWWFPQTLYYVPYASQDFPFFLKATKHKYFSKLAVITGIKDSSELKKLIQQGYKRTNIMMSWKNRTHNFYYMMNIDHLDTLT